MGFPWQKGISSLANMDLFIGDLHMPFTEEVKYSMLGISVILFLIALGIMVWQLFRYFSQTLREPVDEFISSDSQPAKTGVFYKETQNPNVMAEANLKEAQRLSRGLSMDSHLELPSLEDQEQEEEVKGSLRFSLFYDKVQSRLVVTVLEARELPLRDFSHGVDPFVRIWLLWAGHEREEERGLGSSPSLCCVLHEWQSRMVKNNSNPMFGDQFSCSLEGRDVPHITVRFEVRDFDKFSRHGILGEVRVHLCDMKTSYPLEFLEDLQTPQKDLVGEVLLSLKYLHTLQRLEVGLLKIRAPQQSSKKEKALYARISVLCNQFKLRHQKSTVKTRWKVTAFNEVMMFTLPDPQIRECRIVVSVYEVYAANKSSKRLVGQVAFGKTKSSQDEHWSLMMRSVCQPVAKWHPLLI
uniref:C2 domain-containing protein n=1 Tax=Esox lucius TaxID=8010 RepID=A0AAY5K748_ESOLU